IQHPEDKGSSQSWVSPVAPIFASWSATLVSLAFRSFLCFVELAKLEPKPSVQASESKHDWQ
ncbi:hypothetical protein ACTGZS_12265, partial [Streptococcus suis]